MTTITREWLQKTIAEFENTRDDIPFGLDDDDAKILIVLKRALASLEAEPLVPVMYKGMRLLTKEGLELIRDGIAEATGLEAMCMAEALLSVPSELPASERERIRHEHAGWSDATFGDVGPVGPLKHLSKEALEAAADPSDPLEWADMQFLLWDAQRRAGISDERITQAMVEKLAVNKQREWPEPKDGEPRQHVKEQPAPVAPDECYQHLSELYHAQEKRLFKLAQRIKGPRFDKYSHSLSQAIDVLELAILGESEEPCRAADIGVKEA
ncbi:DUF550 domain-containing protein [Salmonella enterica]